MDLGQSQAIFLGGRSGSGKSRVGYEMHAQLSAARVQHCLIEGDNDPKLTAVLLTCGDDTAQQRLAGREIGTALDWHVERSDLMARRLDRHAPEHVHRVATDGRPRPGRRGHLAGVPGRLGGARPPS